MGWFMLLAGGEKIIDPTWSAAGFLQGAINFHSFYAWLALPSNIWWVDIANSWGITLVGVALLTGVMVRIASYGGAFLMLLYYFPQVPFPKVPHGFIVEEHIIYVFVFLLIAYSKEKYALAPILRKSFPFLAKYI